jgi:hypothetical protein
MACTTRRARPRSEPPVLTSMYCLATPSVGGETLFASGRAAYAALPHELQQQAILLEAEYDCSMRPLIPDGTRAAHDDDEQQQQEQEDGADGVGGVGGAGGEGGGVGGVGGGGGHADASKRARVLRRHGIVIADRVPADPAPASTARPASHGGY